VGGHVPPDVESYSRRSTRRTQRYAIVLDPDGNSVDLFAPIATPG
jgi:hypothetical protein